MAKQLNKILLKGVNVKRKGAVDAVVKALDGYIKQRYDIHLLRCVQ